MFNDEIKENFIKNYSQIIKDISNKSNVIISCGVYNLVIKTNYNKLKIGINNIHKNLIENKEYKAE